MKKTDWIDVIGKIDPAYVKEAEQWSKAAQKKRNLKHFTAMAACVCILLAGAVVSFDLWVQNKDTGAETESAVAEGMNEGASAPNEGNETAVAKAEEEQTESVESESFADTDEQITINEVSELTTIAIDVGNGQEERMSAEELEQYYGVTVFPKRSVYFCSLLSTTRLSRAENSSTLIAPRSPSARWRGETVPFSMSRSPTTTM